MVNTKKHNIMTEEEKKDITEENGSENESQTNEQQQQTAEGEGETLEVELETETQKEAEDTQKDPLTKAQEEAAEWEKKYLYKCAEFENYRKRTIKEKAELILNGAEKTITAVLPVIDDMERALANSEKTDDAATLKEGMELIYKKLMKTLEGLGVKAIDTTDKDFDVNFHEAIAMVPGMGDDKKGKVIDCTEKGYTLNDKVIRFAKVAVGQ